MIVLRVRMSLRMSAAECAASANNEEECEITPPIALTMTNITFTALHINTQPPPEARNEESSQHVHDKKGRLGVQANAGNAHAGIGRVLGHQKRNIAMVMAVPMMVMIVRSAHDLDTFQKLFDGALLSAADGHNLAASRVHASRLTKAQQAQGRA